MPLLLFVLCMTWMAAPGCRGLQEEVCTGTYLDIDCPSGHVIVINSATYGALENKTCQADDPDDYGVVDDDCPSPLAVLVLNEKCSGHARCAFNVTTAAFDGVCPGAGNGLSLNYDCVDRNLIQDVCDNTDAISAPPRVGYISSSGYPQPYPAKASCELLVADTDSDKVKIDVLDLEVEARTTSGCYDYLTLMERGVAYFTYHYCGDVMSADEPLSVNFDNLLVRFKTDASKSAMRGFLLRYEVTTVTNTTDDVTSPSTKATTKDKPESGMTTRSVDNVTLPMATVVNPFDAATTTNGFTENDTRTSGNEHSTTMKPTESIKLATVEEPKGVSTFNEATTAFKVENRSLEVTVTPHPFSPSNTNTESSNTTAPATASGGRMRATTATDTEAPTAANVSDTVTTTTEDVSSVIAQNVTIVYGPQTQEASGNSSQHAPTVTSPGQTAEVVTSSASSDISSTTHPGSVSTTVSSSGTSGPPTTTIVAEPTRSSYGVVSTVTTGQTTSSNIPVAMTTRSVSSSNDETATTSETTVVQPQMTQSTQPVSVTTSSSHNDTTDAATQTTSSIEDTVSTVRTGETSVTSGRITVTTTPANIASTSDEATTAGGVPTEQTRVTQIVSTTELPASGTPLSTSTQRTTEQVTYPTTTTQPEVTKQDSEGDLTARTTTRETVAVMSSSPSVTPEVTTKSTTTGNGTASSAASTTDSPSSTVVVIIVVVICLLVVILFALVVMAVVTMRRGRARRDEAEGDEPLKDSGANANAGSGTVSYGMQNPAYDIHDIATGRNIPEPADSGDNGINHQVDVEISDLNTTAAAIKSPDGAKRPQNEADDTPIERVKGDADTSNNDPPQSCNLAPTPAEREGSMSEKSDDSGAVPQNDPVDEETPVQDSVAGNSNSEAGNGDAVTQNLAGDASHQTHSLA